MTPTRNTPYVLLVVCRYVNNHTQGDNANLGGGGVSKLTKVYCTSVIWFSQHIIIIILLLLLFIKVSANSKKVPYYRTTKALQQMKHNWKNHPSAKHTVLGKITYNKTIFTIIVTSVNKKSATDEGCSFFFRFFKVCVNQTNTINVLTFTVTNANTKSVTR